MLHAPGERHQRKHRDHHHRRQRDCDRRHELYPLGSSTSEPTFAFPLSRLFLTTQIPRYEILSNLTCYVFCNERATTSVPTRNSQHESQVSLTTRIALNGKRAARQQGDPFSMGGSSNGGKAIGTLWCKSMFGSGWCQDTIPANRNLLKILGLHRNQRFSSVFLPDSPPDSCNRQRRLRNGHSALATRSAAQGSDSPDAGLKTPALPPQVCPASPESALSRHLGTIPAALPRPSAHPTRSQYWSAG